MALFCSVNLLSNSRGKCNCRKIHKIWEYRGERVTVGFTDKAVFELSFEECVIIFQVEKAAKASQLEKQFTQCMAERGIFDL